MSGSDCCFPRDTTNCFDSKRCDVLVASVEEYAAEDTALSLDLARAEWRIVLVDAWSLECEPESVATHNRRTVRWARQTVELFHGDWRGTPLRLKLLLCRHLLAFVSAPAGFLLLSMSLWVGPSDVKEVLPFMQAALTLSAGYAAYGVALSLAFAICALNLALRVLLARREGIALTRIALASVAACAAYPSVLLPLTVAMIAAALGRRTPFVPTNSQEALAKEARATARIASYVSAGSLLALLLVAVWRRPASALLGFNPLWLTMLATSPLAALVFTRRDRRRWWGDKARRVHR